MVANDNAASLTPRGVLRFIASKLAPTRDMRWSMPYPAGIKNGPWGPVGKLTWRPCQAWNAINCGSELARDGAIPVNI